LIGLTAVVSGLETAIFTLRKHQAPRLARGDRNLEARLRWLAPRLEQSRVRILIPSAALNFTLVLLGLYVIDHIQEPRGSVIAMLFGIVLIGDLAPKIVALSHPAWFFRWFSPAFMAYGQWINPISKACARVSGALERKLVPPSLQRHDHYTQDEFEALVELHQEAGSLKESESELITEILKLGDMTAKDCMTARVDAFTLSLNLDNEEMFHQLEGTGWWKVPLYRDSPDEIVRILDVCEALHDRERPILKSTTEPVFVPETMRALNVFRDFLQEPHSMVIVLDEYGGTEGVLTHEDIVAELVAEDAGSSKPVMAGGRLRVPGSMRIDEVSRKLGVALEAEGLDTIGGLVFTHVGHLPSPGDEVELGAIKAQVSRVSTKRIEEVELERLEDQNGS